MLCLQLHGLGGTSCNAYLLHRCGNSRRRSLVTSCNNLSHPTLHLYMSAADATTVYGATLAGLRPLDTRLCSRMQQRVTSSSSRTTLSQQSLNASTRATTSASTSSLASTTTTIPVLCLPSTLTFHSVSSAEVLTVYNPASVAFNFTVLASASAQQKYTVQPASGSLPANSSVKIYIRCKRQSDDPSTKEQLKVELTNTERTVYGSTLVIIKHNVSAQQTQSGSKSSRPPAADSKSANAVPASTPYQILLTTLHYLPLIVGSLLIYNLQSVEPQTSSNTTLWLCYTIGLITMLIQLQLHQTAK